MVTTQGGHSSASSGGGAATFADFLRRVCAGDEAAATELVQRYESALRLEVQLRLTDPKLRRLLDPADPCRSVLKSCFIRARTGQFVVDSQEELMARMSHGFSEPGPAAAGQMRGGLLGDKAR